MPSACRNSSSKGKQSGGGTAITQDVSTAVAADNARGTKVKESGGGSASAYNGLVSDSQMLASIMQWQNDEERIRRENEQMRQKEAEDKQRAKEKRENAEKSGAKRTTKARFNKMGRAERQEAIAAMPIGTEITFEHDASGGWGRVKNVVRKEGDNAWRAVSGTRNNMTHFQQNFRPDEDWKLASPRLTATNIKYPRAKKSG